MLLVRVDMLKITINIKICKIQFSFCSEIESFFFSVNMKGAVTNEWVFMKENHQDKDYWLFHIAWNIENWFFLWLQTFSRQKKRMPQTWLVGPVWSCRCCWRCRWRRGGGTWEKLRLTDCLSLAVYSLTSGRSPSAWGAPPWPPGERRWWVGWRDLSYHYSLR